MGKLCKWYLLFGINSTCSISSSAKPTATKLGRVMTKVDNAYLTKLHVTLIMWSCDVTEENKIITSPLPQDQ